MKTTKQGLDYYPLDVNFMSDYSVQVLMKYCGLQSVPVLMELMGRIYRKEGYFIPYDEELVFIISKFFSLSEEEVEAIIRKAIDCKIFDKTMFDKHQILTSDTIQEHFVFAAKRRKNIKIHTDYLLIDSLIDDKCIHDVNMMYEKNDKEKNRIEKNRKENLKNKIEEGEGEKRKENLTSVSPPPPPSSPPSWKFDFNVYLKNLDTAYSSLLSNEAYIRRKELYYPELDIRLTIEKMISDFWGTRAGWECKKKQREPDINWKLTFDRQFSDSYNHVMKVKN